MFIHWVGHYRTAYQTGYHTPIVIDDRWCGHRWVRWVADDTLLHQPHNRLITDRRS
ncbi:MAG: hypothetical protein J07HQW2_01468 [Haloquadratum walsbyi J07HQW2]|uniref:Uncharacterized protein n=1 Tax=Haloquadratum walsbyi J07HQW2 TaxID=1238425 RepID=U1MX46_9EURY|nr:MAG: hypothetical protein J07HQW2_01468 [Haloquadratum walsbyi J07HQW2]